MEVKVDSSLIRSARENRGWSQGHLATVSGLSLRTIQRIEKTGSASLESVTALAAVFSVQVAELRAHEAEPLRPRAIRVSLELPARLALAVLSGVLCALFFRFRWSGWAPGLDWFDFGTAGALFGVAVLCPYLRAGQKLMTRALALIGASALSYFSAVMTVLSTDVSYGPAPFLLGSFVGVTVVLVAAKLLIPLRVTAAFWFLGLAAALVGGAAMYAGFEVFHNTTLSNVVGFCVWHVLACLAIDRGREADDAEDGLLAAFARARGRFSIVPGWMRLSSRMIGSATVGRSRAVNPAPHSV